MKKKRILVAIIVFVLIALVVDEFLPQPYDKFFDKSVITEGTQFQSPFVEIHNKEYSVMSYVAKGVHEDNKDLFTVAVLERYGILKNKEVISAVMEFPTDRVTDPQYEKMVSIPEDEIKRGNKYYGFVYYGIAPLDCKEITIDGKQAELQKMSYNINDEKADFNFYYCIIESDKYEEYTEVICTDINGEKHIIK